MTNLHILVPTKRDEPIESDGGGGGEKPKKKVMQGKMPRKKIHAKEKVKKKIHAEGRSNCDFSEILSLFQKV